MDIAVTLGAILVGTGLWLAILRRYDRIEPESLQRLVMVGVIGGFISVVAAALVNEGISRWLGIRAHVFADAGDIPIRELMIFTLVVGVTEEIFKAVSTVYVTRRFGNLDEPIDAMIYAMTVGLGFAAMENLLYATRFGNDVLLVRFLWPVPAHMAYAALWGYGLALARFVHPNRNRAEVMWPGVLLAGLVHAGSNFLLFMQESYTALVSLGALGVLAYLAHLRLTRLIAESPFLEPGECPSCRNLNPPQAQFCMHCGWNLQETEIFATCRNCGEARVNLHNDRCPNCGVEYHDDDPTNAELPDLPGQALKRPARHMRRDGDGSRDVPLRS